MKINSILDDFTESNTFELKYVKGRLWIYYYDKIKNFTSNEIEVDKKENNIKIKGNNLVIETLYADYMIISGDLKTIEF